jgi:hypothetical protein
METAKHNEAKVKALQKINGCKWNGTTTHSNLEACLTAINLQSSNSGHYNPKAIKINKVEGYFMLNQDGGIFCEARVIKKADNLFVIEYLSNTGWNEFESLYENFLSN